MRRDDLQLDASLVLRDGVVADGERSDDLKALIAAAPAFGGPGFLVPTRHFELLRWCLYTACASCSR